MTVLIAVIAGLAAVQQNAVAEDDYKFGVGMKVWVAEADLYDEDGGFYALFGPIFTVDFNNDLFFTLKGVIGEEEYGWRETNDRIDFESVIGKTYRHVDLGLGIMYVSGSSKYADVLGSYSGYGPMLYIGIGNVFADGPFGWYASGSVAPWLFGDLSDSDVFFGVEGGLSFSAKRWSGTVGYKLKSEDYHQKSQGIAASLAFRF